MGESLPSVWRRVLSLSWPVMVEQTTRTLMRTVDILATALFSPVAVAAIGLADLYARFPLRVGLGTGSGAIALSSQDTGSGATANRDEAISRALVVGALVGVPFAALGVTYVVRVVLGYGVVGAYLGLGLTYVWMALVVAVGFHAGEWADRAADMLQDRGSLRAE